MPNRSRVLAKVADLLVSARTDHPLRVGVDGVCGAGKTTFARELVAVLRHRGEPAEHLDSDGFHKTRALRYQAGRDSPRGYYEHAYDFDALAARVLTPLGPGGSRSYASRVHDLDSDEVISDACTVAPQDAIVVFDCTFLQRGSLRELWDEVVFLNADRGECVQRGAARDAARLGGQDAALAAFERRYMAACDIYLTEEEPMSRASIVIDHSDPQAPSIARVGTA